MRRSSVEHSEEINITPMLDIVFILLIFFIVTTSFQKETGIDLSRPSSNPETAPQTKQIVLKIGPLGQYRMNGRIIQGSVLEANLARAHAQNPENALIIATDRRAKTESLVSALDHGQLAGFKSILVTTIRLD